MKSINISRILGTATLVLALGLFDFSIKPKAPFQTDNFASYMHRISLTHPAYADTILNQSGGMLPSIIRLMYMLINGPGENGYPDGHGGPDGGFLGMIRQITGPDALGGGLIDAGYTSCSSIPATGNHSMTDPEGTFTMHFETPVKTIPTGYTGAGSNFDKRVVVDLDGTTFMNIEFNCDTTVGWMRLAMGESGVITGPLRHIEVYYDTTNSANAKLELYMHYEPGVATGNEYFVAKFQTLSSSTYKFWIIRSQDKTGEVMGFRSAAYGDTSNHNVNAFMFFELNTIADTDDNIADNNDVLILGDIQCIDFSTPASAVAGSGCGSLTLDANAGSPIIGGSDVFSIDWTSDTANGLKNDMTVLADPV